MNEGVGGGEDKYKLAICDTLHVELLRRKGKLNTHTFNPDVCKREVGWGEHP